MNSACLPAFRVKGLCLGFTLAMLLLLAGPMPAVQAQDAHRAGLVIVHGDGTTAQYCVAFPEASISGYELLTRAGLTLSVEAAASGATICSIDGEGCNFPQESCFCQCQGSPCVYWSYWRMTEDGWLYQNMGAGNTNVRDGDVEGWHWAAGTTRNAEAPPAIAFDEICTAEEAVAGVAGATVEATVVAATGAATQPLPVATVGMQGETVAAMGGGAAVQAPAATETAVNAGLVMLLGIVVVPVVILMAFAVWRRRSAAP
jgi:hypothetical protein